MPQTEGIGASRAVLVTDLEGSTALAEALSPAQVGALWAKHDRVARDLIRRHDGLEIDKSDGFLILFGDVPAAMAFGAAYHAALTTLGAQLGVRLAARVGIHHGDVTLRANPAEDVASGAKPIEVDGPAKAVAARVMSVAHGGQTLITQVARQRAVAESGAWSIVDHGYFRMKGVAEPIVLHEVVAGGQIPLGPPADADKVYRVIPDENGFRPARHVPHNLPSDTDSFVGRAAELHRIFALVEQGTRLVTILGPAGTGKTRLARRYGHRSRGDFPGGVWFCDLTDARTIGDVTRAAELATGITPGADPVEHIGRVLAERPRTLLIADNCEGVVDVVGKTLAAWLARAPDLVVVATSRIRLHVRGEHAVAIEPLPLPPPFDAPSVALFAARASAANPQFQLDTGNFAVVAEIVSRLEGLPLALELAAARVRSIPPSDLLAMLSQRFRVLSGGRRDAATRQATLRGAIDWSWSLLSAEEQAAAAALSVFRGGFEARDAEAVLGADAQITSFVTDLLEALVDQSFLRTTDAPGGVRFGMYESLREYLSERLDTSPAARAVRDRHAEHFAQSCRPNLDRFTWPSVDQRRVVTEIENVRVAHTHAHAVGLPQAATLTVTLGQGLEALAQWGEVDELLRDFVDGDVRLSVAAAISLAMSRFDRGRQAEAAAILTEATSLADARGSAELQALVRGRLGTVLWYLGREDEAQSVLRDALARLPATADPLLRAHTGLFLGVSAAHRGDTVTAAPYYDALWAAAEASGEPAARLHAAGQMAILRYMESRFDEAVTMNEQALVLARDLRARRFELNGTCNHVDMLLRAGRRVDAERVALDGLERAHAMGATRHETTLLGMLLPLALGRGDWAAAAVHARAVGAEGSDLRVGLMVAAYGACLRAARGEATAARAALRELVERSVVAHDVEVQEALALADVWLDVWEAHGSADAARSAAARARVDALASDPFGLREAMRRALDGVA